MKESVVLEVPKVVGALFREFPQATVKDILSLLNRAKLDAEKVHFIYKIRFFVVCPSCSKKRLKLYRTEDRFACAKCQRINTKKRRIPLARKGLTPLAYARYVRPLKILFSLEGQLAKSNLTARQRVLIENKRTKLLHALPDYVRVLSESFSPAQRTELIGEKKVL